MKATGKIKTSSTPIKGKSAYKGPAAAAPITKGVRIIGADKK